MTFIEAVDFYKKKYNTKNELVIFEIIFFLSATVKSKNDFILNGWKPIDFRQRLLNKKLKQYFINQKPLAHIVHCVTFCNTNFKINKKVLAPRDVTESIVTNFINKYKDSKPMTIYDLCCGSGVIGITIKKNCPQHKVTCVDIDTRAIINTKQNVKLNNVEISIRKINCFLFLENNDVPDLIISNPPYISKKDKINKKMLRYEKKRALYAKNNGLYFYQKFHEYLIKNNKCKAWFEIGFNQYDSLFSLFCKSNYGFYTNFNCFFANNYVLMIVNDKI